MLLNQRKVEELGQKIADEIFEHLIATASDVEIYFGSLGEEYQISLSETKKELLLLLKEQLKPFFLTTGILHYSMPTYFKFLLLNETKRIYPVFRRIVTEKNYFLGRAEEQDIQISDQALNRVIGDQFSMYFHFFDILGNLSGIQEFDSEQQETIKQTLSFVSYQRNNTKEHLVSELASWELIFGCRMGNGELSFKGFNRFRLMVNPPEIVERELKTELSHLLSAGKLLGGLKVFLNPKGENRAKTYPGGSNAFIADQMDGFTSILTTEMYKKIFVEKWFSNIEDLTTWIREEAKNRVVGFLNINIYIKSIEFDF